MGILRSVSPDSAERIVAAIRQTSLCEACISLKSGVPLAAVPGYLNGLRNTMMVSAAEAHCDACQQRRVVYRAREGEAPRPAPRS